MKALSLLVSSFLVANSVHCYSRPSQDQLPPNLVAADSSQLQIQMQFSPLIRAQDYKTAYQQIYNIINNPYNITFNLVDGTSIQNIPSADYILIPEGGTLMIFKTIVRGNTVIQAVPVENISSISYTQ